MPPQTISAAGDYIELDKSDPLRINSDKPVQVAQYAKSWDDASVGDPFEMVIIPRERFSLKYRFYSPPWFGTSEGNYVTIIAPNTLTNAWLDDGLVTAWTSDPNIGKYATIDVNPGEPHTVEADCPVGVCSYGYKKYGSYGYPAGAPGYSDMYPDVALDPHLPSNYKTAHLKWQTDRGGFWRIYETRRIGYKDPGAEYIIAELFREELPGDIFTFNLHRVNPYENITANNSIAYGFSFGLTQPGHYQFRVSARDSVGYEATTDWIKGPVVGPLIRAPDLVITHMEYWAPNVTVPKIGDYVGYNLTIKNVGDAEARGPFTIRAWLNDEPLIWERYPPEFVVAPGEIFYDQQCSYTTFSECGANEIKAKVDSEDEVKECNESNNERFLTVNVTELPDKINATMYKNSITQPVDVSKIRFVHNAVDEEWVKSSKWPKHAKMQMYWQKDTKYLITLTLDSDGYVQHVEFSRCGNETIAEIPYDLAKESLASLPPGFAIDP